VEIPERKVFSEHYKEQLFLLWYAEGKPSIPSFMRVIPPDTEGKKPSKVTLTTWSSEEWRTRANLLDDEVKQQIEAHAIAEKVEMLSRHADIGKNLQETGAEYLKEHADELKPSTAVRMIVEGVRIEQNSRGIGTAFKEMVETSDEELTEKIGRLMEKSQVEILQIEDDDSD